MATPTNPASVTTIQALWSTKEEVAGNTRLIHLLSSVKVEVSSRTCVRRTVLRCNLGRPTLLKTDQIACSKARLSGCWLCLFWAMSKLRRVDHQELEATQIQIIRTPAAPISFSWCHPIVHINSNSKGRLLDSLQRAKLLLLPLIRVFQTIQRLPLCLPPKRSKLKYTTSFCSQT